MIAGGIRFALRMFCQNNVSFHCNEEVLTMRKVLLMVCLIAAVGVVAVAQENQTPENKDKNAAAKTADKAKDATDKAAKGVKKTGEKTKEVAGETADKADDVKDKTVDTTKKGVNEVGDKAEDAKDKTATGVKAATKGAKAIGGEAADKAGDVKDKTAKGAKKSGNWLTRTFKKIF